MPAAPGAAGLHPRGGIEGRSRLVREHHHRPGAHVDGRLHPTQRRTQLRGAIDDDRLVHRIDDQGAAAGGIVEPRPRREELTARGGHAQGTIEST